MFPYLLIHYTKHSIKSKLNIDWYSIARRVPFACRFTLIIAEGLLLCKTKMLLLDGCIILSFVEQLLIKPVFLQKPWLDDIWTKQNTVKIWNI